MQTENKNFDGYQNILFFALKSCFKVVYESISNKLQNIRQKQPYNNNLRESGSISRKEQAYCIFYMRFLTSFSFLK